jgi:hypothetical protein
MKYRLIIIPCVIAVASVVYLAVDFFGHADDAIAFAGPRLECVNVIDFGDRNLGEQTTQTLAIRNVGNSELIIKNVRTSCSCSGLNRLIEGKYHEVKTERIPPHSEDSFQIRLSVRGVPVGTSFSSMLYIETNDPNNPEHTITLISRNVWGGILHHPNIASFGTVMTGAIAEQIIDFYDSQHTDRSITHFSTSDPETIFVRTIEQPQGALLKNPFPVTRPLQRVAIRINTVKSKSVDGFVYAHTNYPRDQAVQIQVVGFVKDNLECTPNTLYCPTDSTQQSMWSGTLSIVSNHGDRHVIQNVKSDHFTADFVPHSAVNTLIRLKCKHERIPRGTHNIFLEILVRNVPVTLIARVIIND